MLSLQKAPIYICFMLTTIVLSISQRISTKHGDIDGQVRTIRGETVYEFLNIPYAKPPIGELRFQKPQPFGNWTGVLNGISYGPTCMQAQFLDFRLPSQDMSEDCLSLNVIVPRHVSMSSYRSVMVWIHGGGYSNGAAKEFDSAPLTLMGNVITVTINYRLSVFGFMTTGDSVSPGNYGLWDQILAIKWVKENIQAFGGNPDSVTIFGESAGGWSVGLLSLIPSNRGLFQKVIAGSGVANSFSSMSEGDATQRYRNVASVLNCPTTTSVQMTSCMRGKSAIDILHATSDPYLLNGRTHFGIGYGPVIDGDLFITSPMKLINNTSSDAYRFFRSLDYMAGNCNKEGILLLMSDAYFSDFFNISLGIPTHFFCSRIVPPVMKNVFDNVSSSTLSLVNKLTCAKYTASPVGKQALAALDFFGDAFFVVPAVKSLDIHSKGNTKSKTYQYMFNRPELMSSSFPWFSGSGHGAEIPYLFNFRDTVAMMNLSVPAAEYRLSDMMMKYWTNFAKTGIPHSDELPAWLQYNPMNRAYLNLDLSTTSKNHVFGDRVSFWLNLLPRAHSISLALSSIIG